MMLAPLPDLLPVINQRLGSDPLLFPRIGGSHKIRQIAYVPTCDTYYAFLEAGMLWQTRPLRREELNRLLYFLGLGHQRSD